MRSCRLERDFIPTSRGARMCARTWRSGATIGANATVVCGHTIGRYAFIGAGAVVTKDVPDYALVVGNPGRVTGWMCECGVKLAIGPAPPVHVRCRTCGAEYLSRQRVLLRT